MALNFLGLLGGGGGQAPAAAPAAQGNPGGLLSWFNAPAWGNTVGSGDAAGGGQFGKPLNRAGLLGHMLVGAGQSMAQGGSLSGAFGGANEAMQWEMFRRRMQELRSGGAPLPGSPGLPTGGDLY